MRGAHKAAAIVIAILAVILTETSPAAALGQWPAAPWAIPTGTRIGNWIWGTPLPGGATHTGVDLWTKLDCTGTGSDGVEGEAVYATAGATVKYLWWLNSDNTVTTSPKAGDAGSVKFGVSLYHQAAYLYTYYWHMANQSTRVSYVNSSLAVGQGVTMGTLLGYQGNATGVYNSCTHLHFTVSTNPGGDDWSTAVNPTYYIGPDVSYTSPNHVPTDGSYLVSYNGP